MARGEVSDAKKLAAPFEELEVSISTVDAARSTVRLGRPCARLYNVGPKRAE